MAMRALGEIIDGMLVGAAPHLPSAYYKDILASPAPALATQARTQRISAVTVYVRDAKIQQQMDRLVALLPMTIASKIVRLDFMEPDKAAGYSACFQIMFNNGRMLEFNDIDAFPTDEHIARIALDCP